MRITKRHPPAHPTPFPSLSRIFTVACALTLALLAACSSPGSDPAEDRAAIQQMLEAYLPLLGQAYTEQDPELIEPYAVPKEVARIELRIEELAAQGQVYAPELVQVTVEDVSVWNYSNAFVTTLEVWDVRAVTPVSRQVINQSLGQRSRVKYQLKRKDDGWVVLYRELEQTFDS